MKVEQVISKVASQIKGDWIDAWNYLYKFGFDRLELSATEKNLINQYF